MLDNSKNSEIHAFILPAVEKAVFAGVTARELKTYFEAAAKGMGINAAFGLKGEDLLEILRCENTA